MTNRVLIGASVPAGVQGLEVFRRLKLGDCALAPVPADPEELRAMLRYCRRHGITLFIEEFLRRGRPEFRDPVKPLAAATTRPQRDRILDDGGAAFAGRYTIGEAGGILYWPKAYTIARRVGEWPAMPPVSDMDQARDAYVSWMRRILQFERRRAARGPLMNVDSSIVFKYHAEAGIDILCLEMMPGDPHLMLAAIRGAARAYSKPWASHIAMACYGGVNFDTLWLKRWRTSLYYSYISGADFIWPESGHFTYDQRRGQKFGLHSPEMRAVRRTLREVYQFSRLHTRPADGPRVSLGVVHGNLDGAPGLWNPFVWGQYRGAKWREGPAERGWRLTARFFRKEDWPKETVQGETDFSGNPPYGQYDAVPAEASLDILRRYSCLVFLGWNTMTAGLYAKLRAYVRGGGRLIMWLAHLGTQTDRADSLRLYRGGDFRDLFGVKVIGKDRTDVQGVKCFRQSSLPDYRFPFWRIKTDPRFLGRFTPARCRVTTAQVLSAWSDYYPEEREQLERQPILIENSCGKGTAFLVLAWEHPASDGLLPFTEDILRAALQGEQGAVRLLASDRVRYAVYDAAARGSRRRHQVIYLLNTDPDCDSPARLWVNGRLSPAFDVPANSMRLVYRFGDLLVTPADKRVDLAAWTRDRGVEVVEVHNAVRQRVEVFNLGTTPARLRLNGVECRCPAGVGVSVALARYADLARKAFYAPRFLEEPAVECNESELPY
jgi:hypothetical protein